MLDTSTIMLIIASLTILIFLILLRYCLQFRYFLLGRKIHLIIVDQGNKTLVNTDEYKIFYSGVTKKIKKENVCTNFLPFKMCKKFYSSKKNEGIKLYVPRNKETNLLILTNKDEIIYEGEISGEDKKEYLIPIKYDDHFNLKRFLDAQNPIYQYILHDLRVNKLRDDWAPFIFPILINHSDKDGFEFFKIKNEQEAEDFFAHPILGKRLIEFTKIVLSRDDKIEEIFNNDAKDMFYSCMTLFAKIAGKEEPIFINALSKFFGETSSTNFHSYPK